MKNPLNKLITPLILSLTLGLAPFFPEPHLAGKIRWIIGGANGMQTIDWLDFIFHGFPWAWLLTTLIFMFVNKRKINA